MVGRRSQEFLALWRRSFRRNECDDAQRTSAAVRATEDVAGGQYLWWREACAQKGTSKGDVVSTCTVREKAVVADAHEPGWKDVQQEAT